MSGTVQTVALAYCSGAGHTRRLAEHIATGVEAAGARAVLVDVTAMTAADWATLAAAHAILFGAPTYMGSAAAGFKTFMDASSDIWAGQIWANKLAGGFSVGTFPSGDKLSTLVQLTVFAAQHGMLWVGQQEIGAPVDAGKPDINQSGKWLGLGATSVRDKSLMISSGDAETARRFGTRMAVAAQRWG
ncbi:tryptophan repressor-binding protein [Rhodobacterales bacterium 59_46_T64]|nr:tryptophan repressor-binding protein [Rhodobacterales bacterium 59_46_T64]